MFAKVYLGFADPEQNLDAGRYRTNLAFQCLVLDQPVIQDNFLLWGTLQRAARNDGLIYDLISRKILGLALRDSVDSFSKLNEGLAAKALVGKYVPFPGDTPETYSSNNFRAYSDSLNTALESGLDPVWWTPAELGMLFRAKMMDSAANSEWGTSSLLLGAFEAAEELAIQDGRQNQTCSDYWFVADKYYSGKDNLQIKRWARSYYLTNLSDKYDLASCMPTRLAVVNTESPGVSDLPWVNSEDDLTVLQEGLFNPYLLQTIDAAGIEELRKESSFQEMQTALLNDDTHRANFKFRQYAQAVYEKAPVVLPALAKKREEAARNRERGATTRGAATLVGGLVTVAFGVAACLAGRPDLALLSPAGGGAAATAAQVIGGRQIASSKQKQNRLLQEARQLLQQSRYKGNLLSLVDVLYSE